jgi:hypothetical protein
MDGGGSVGRVGDTYSPSQLVAADNEERGGNGGVGGKVGDFHSQPIRSNDVVTVNLEVSTS